jgi:lipoyl(octanoyl) transferase
VRRTLDVVSLLQKGLVSYDEAFLLQKQAEARVKAGGPGTLLLLEHRDVVTIGRNADARDLHVSEAALASLGIDLRVSNRGGKLTYHGPGQLVAYPILNLAPARTDVRRYVRDLEEVLILTSRDFGVEATRSERPERWSSVWVGNDKLAAIGVHLSRWVTTHGAALNVSTKLARFSLFTPCGIADGGVTSIERLVPGLPPPPLQQVAESFVTHFMRIFDRGTTGRTDEIREPAAFSTESQKGEPR